jgi:hypothetical protein
VLRREIREIAHREEARYIVRQHPCDLYNTNFSVWECIIIIGGGVGVGRGGVTAKLDANQGKNWLYPALFNIIHIIG